MNPFRHRLRWLIAVSAVLLLSLSACSKAPAETTAPPEPAKTETTAPQTEPQASESVPTEPVITEPVETEPQTAGSIPTEPVVTAPAVTEPHRIDYKNLVSDAYADAFMDAYNCTYCFHIPQFNLPDDQARQINQKLYDHCHGILERAVYGSMNEYGYPDLGRMLYGWGHHEGLASVVIGTYPSVYDDVVYEVYSISAATGLEVSTDELLAAYDLDREDFYALVIDYLTQYWEEMSIYQGNTGDEFFDDRVTRTLADKNILQSVPFISPSGELAFVVNIYSLAGGDSYWHLINASDSEEIHLKCTKDHSAELSANSNPLEYFIANCDSRYFTDAEISGFDEKDLLYARNAIYAKSGWIFSSQELANFFRKYSWYIPSVTSDEFTEDMLNPYQIANRNLIVNRENKLKGGDQDMLEHFIENCDRRYFTMADIQGFDKEMCLYARNAIFAKSGWIFSSQELANYFQRFDWYTPLYTADAFSDDFLNEYQIANRDLILKYEDSI